MNRREFLRAGAAAIAAASLPKIASTAGAVEEWEAAAPRMGRVEHQYWAKFNPALEYGNILRLTYDPPPELRDKLVGILYEDMVRHIPPGYREKVRIVQPARTDYGRMGGIAWRYRP